MERADLLPFIWYEFCRTIIALGAILGFRIRYFGQGNIPRKGPFLMVANHQSHLDPPLIGAGCPRQMSFVARKTLFDIPILGPLIANLHAIPIDRDGMGISGIKESLRRLKHGDPILLFPEGTRSKTGEISQFRPGFTALAVRSKAAIVPVAIDGAYQAWPRSQHYPLPGWVDVYYGRPIEPETVKGLDDRQLLNLVEQRVRECFDELRRRRKAGRR
jgi:1-acyl-sn-glycerol-3-phosphate acyltransferase